MKLYVVVRIPNRIIRENKDVRVCHLSRHTMITPSIDEAKKIAEEMNTAYGKRYIYTVYRLTEVNIKIKEK